MSARYTLSIHIELGAVRTALFDEGKKIKEVIRTVRVREHLVKDFFKTVESLLQDAVESVVRKNPLFEASVFIATPLAYAVTDTIVFEFKKNIPHQQHVVQEIEPDVPLYVAKILGENARDGVYIQHPPHSMRVRGYEVPLNTSVLGPYEGTFYLQWVTRVIYESVRKALLSYDITPTFVVEKKNEYATVRIGVYESQFFLPHSVSAFPLAFGVHSLRCELADMYDVPLTHVHTVLHGQRMQHVQKHPYTSFVYKKIHDAVRNLSSVLPVQITHQPMIIQGGAEIQYLVERAFKDVCGYVVLQGMKTNKK